MLLRAAVLASCLVGATAGYCKASSPQNACGVCGTEGECGNWGGGYDCLADKDPSCGSPAPSPSGGGQEFNIKPLANEGMCLDLPGGDPKDGNKLWIWQCNGENSQKWRFDPGTWQIRFAGDTSKCIDVPGSNFAQNGNQLWVWDCNGQKGQYWGYDGTSKTIYASNSLAAEQNVNSTQKANGSKLQSPLASACMDLYGGNANNGGAVTVWGCSNDDNNQKWDIVPAGGGPGPSPSPPPSPSGGPCRLYSGTKGDREGYLLKGAVDHGYRSTELAQFMAQCAHECDSFNTMTEYASGREYEGRTDLGNTHPGDGVRYKGRGFIQITGRANYRTFGGYIGQDLEGNPTLAERPDIAAQVALQYWDRRVKPYISDWSNTYRVTPYINGGHNGEADRESKFAQYQKVCGSATQDIVV